MGFGPNRPRSKGGKKDAGGGGGRGLPYRRGETLGKQMRRGPGRKKGGAPGGGPRRATEGKDGRAEMSDVEEWGGLDETERVEEETEESEEEVAPVPEPPAKGKATRKPTGGTGKKVKTFVEAKSDLLSLAASISGEQAAKSQAKLERAKNRPAPQPKETKKHVNEAKEKQLAAARAVVAARTKAKKDKKREAEAPKPAAPVSEGKKGVRFA
ncbi:hypothetical protein NBRC10512_007234 [Rhodotorula toruloides]|uniref:RHTO0S15e02036g1_1 n=2 Tax=Rhodotorula toruloides TaxID=5286 RepID=A0A061BEK0_RHOTO|nr:uncharacterized protein RHTO_03215 [Rhodotorula toruloides NP11]EMS25486.1 hypothetical protein RHTO_03215 [Rhodotorula toruloides NP11]CDR47797.1 RHTO0S15e02036g1_1 [Rhodotorula toruloides]